MDTATGTDWARGQIQRTWLERRPLVGRIDDETRRVRLARENMRLAEENARLRTENADLAASAEIWIRLYEAALARASKPERVESSRTAAAPAKHAR